MGKLLILLAFALIGIGGGVGAGYFLKPPPAESPGTDHADDAHADKPAAPEGGHGTAGESSYVKIGRQMIIPVVEARETQALMLFELAVDVPAEDAGTVHAMEPRLRDAFLRELFRMSHTGAFMKNYTDEHVIEELRRNLTRAAREHLHLDSAEVLILDVMRQEM